MQLQEALHVIRGCLLSPYGTRNQQRLDEAWHTVSSTLNDQQDYIKKLEKETDRNQQVFLHDSALTVAGLQARLAFVRKQYGDIPIECYNAAGRYDTAEDVIVESIGPPEQQHLVAFITT